MATYVCIYEQPTKRPTHPEAVHEVELQVVRKEREKVGRGVQLGGEALPMQVPGQFCACLFGGSGEGVGGWMHAEADRYFPRRLGR